MYCSIDTTGWIWYHQHWDSNTCALLRMYNRSSIAVMRKGTRFDEWKQCRHSYVKADNGARVPLRNRSGRNDWFGTNEELVQINLTRHSDKWCRRAEGESTNQQIDTSQPKKCNWSNSNYHSGLRSILNGGERPLEACFKILRMEDWE